MIGRLRHKRKARGVPTGKRNEKRNKKAAAPVQQRRREQKEQKRFRTEKTTVPDQNDDSSDHKRRRFRAKELHSSIPDSVRNRPPENAELSLFLWGPFFWA